MTACLEEICRDRTTLRVREIATVLSCSPQHICNLVKRGQLAAVNARAGQRTVSTSTTRVAVAAFRAFVQKNSK